MAVARYENYSSFFNEKRDKAALPDSQFKQAKLNAALFNQSHYGSDVYPDLSQIEHESSALYQIFLDSQADTQKLIESGLIEMLTFSSQLLFLHYQSYPKKSLMAVHEKRLNEIHNFVNHVSAEKAVPNDIKSRYEWVKRQVIGNFDRLWKLLCQPAALRDQLGWTNLSRIFWVFYHFSLNEMILVVRNADILEKLGRILGAPIDLDAFYNLLNTPNDFLNILSVAFFGIRLVIDVIMLAKHTWSDDMSTDNTTTPWQRFCAELDKRACNISNCLVWGGVNAATNYAQFFGIPLQFAMPIVAGVLTFDMTLSLILWYRQDNSFARALAVLSEQIASVKDLSRVENKKYLNILKLEEKVLTEKREVANAVFQFNSTAAFIMMVSFSASLMLASPLAILACYFVCCVSLSLFSCADPDGGEYARYVIASRNLAFAQNQEGKFSLLELQELSDTANEEFNHLQSVILERAFAPLILLVLYAVNPLLGLSLTAAYLAYKMTQAYASDVKEKKPVIALNQFRLFSDNKEEPKASNKPLLEDNQDTSDLDRALGAK